MNRNIFLYGIPRKRTAEAFSAALAFVKWYEKPERWEKEKIKYADFTVHESAKGNVIVRMF
jgi:hypothetical protein